MSLTLPPVGTTRLLELLSPYAPDDFIAEVCPRHFTGGRRHTLSAAQLWRTHLLAGLTSTHSLNLLVAQLPEQVAWRRFARLRHPRLPPTALRCLQCLLLGWKDLEDPNHVGEPKHLLHRWAQSEQNEVVL